MNAERRKKIDAVIEKIEAAKADLKAIRDEEQEAYDNMPESLQNSERGDKAVEAIDGLESVASELDSQIEELNCITSA